MLLGGLDGLLEETRGVSVEKKPFDSGARAAVVVSRGDLVESQHFVSFALVDAVGTLVASQGDVERPVFLRSSAKPLICTAVVASGAADRFHFSDEEIALAAASHSGEPLHVAGVRSMLRKIGLDESALQCGVHAPSHEPSAQALCAAGILPSAIHNNCSGKHAGILALALQLGADPRTYLSAQHPAQVAILATCAELLGVPREQLVIAVDGCGIPVIAVPLRVAAQCFARLSDLERFPERYRAALMRVCAAMLAHPEYVAGTGRFDTDLMLAARPGVLGKGGAEGYHASAALEHGLGLTVKVADGNYRAVSPFVIATLQRAGALTDTQVERLAKHRYPRVRNHAGLVVGAIDLAEPG